MNIEESIKKLQKMIDESSNIVFFGGAGVSTDSGMKDFRSKDGLYNVKSDQPAEYMLSSTCFYQEPEKFYDYYKSNMNSTKYKPNITHEYLAKLEKTGKLKAIVTQNIDGLHQKAGSKNVLEVHDTVEKNHCLKCNKFYSSAYVFDSTGIPKCECGGIIKPDVVLYGEMLPETYITAQRYIYEADMLIVAGTSLVVEPASSLVKLFHGKNLVILNNEKTPYDTRANLVIHHNLKDIFSKLKINNSIAKYKENSMNYTNILEKVKNVINDIDNNILSKRKADTLKIEEKTKANYVTKYDKEIEAYLKQELSKIVPSSSFLGEEGTNEENDSIYKWIVDPIDGTTNFIHNLTFSISIALMENNTPALGVVFNGLSKDLYWAIKNQGAYLNNEPIHCGSKENIKDSLLIYGYPYDLTKTKEIVDIVLKLKITGAADIKRIGPASLDTCLVASGSADGYIELDLEPWDLAAATLILKEAGGSIIKISGEAYDYQKSSVLITNSSSKLQTEILSLINESNKL